MTITTWHGTSCGSRYADPTVTVSGETIVDSIPDNSRDAYASVTVGASGNMFKRENVTVTQIDTSTDWVRPQVWAPQYWVRFTVNTPFGDAVNIGSSLIGVWSSTAAVNREVGYEVTTNDTELSGTITIAIATDSSGTNIVDSGTYLITATKGAI